MEGERRRLLFKQILEISKNIMQGVRRSKTTIKPRWGIDCQNEKMQDVFVELSIERIALCLRLIIIHKYMEVEIYCEDISYLLNHIYKSWCTDLLHSWWFYPSYFLVKVACLCFYTIYC